MYTIRMGVPEMEDLWTDLTGRYEQNKLSKDEKEFFKKFVKILDYLRNDPRHPSLKTHDIDPLSKRYGFKVWQSYLENKKSGARRIFWTYGPDRKEITILGVEPHPEDTKRGAYDRIKLSDMPPFR